MRISILRLGLLLAACAFAPEASAQAGLREGVRVRVSSPGAPRVTGVLQSVTADSLVIYAEPGATRFGIARSSIGTLQVSHGRSAAAGAKKGALWGLATFGVVGAIGVGLVGTGGGEDVPNAALLVAAVVAEGAGIGAIIGAFVKAERWETVNVRPVLGYGGNGLRLGVAIR